MGLLDPTPERFVPKERKYKPKDNFTELQNFDREKVTEDFEDSPFADRKKKED